MEAEHLYHWLGRFFKESPKITWEKNEIQDALKEQYIELLNSDLPVEPPIPRSSARTPPAHQEPTPKLIQRTLDLARLNVKAVSLGRLVALLEKKRDCVSDHDVAATSLECGPLPRDVSRGS